MDKEIYQDRLEAIRSKLQRGDKKRISERMNVHYIWVIYVFSGKGVSEPVLRTAEALIAEREQTRTNKTI